MSGYRQTGALWVLSTLAAGLSLLACGSDDSPGTDPMIADAAIPDAQRPDALPLRDHEPPTQAGIDYFEDISLELEDQALVVALHDKLANDHQGISFAGLLEAYETTDGNRGGCSGIFDFYSDTCWQPDDACGDYSVEGDCFNREHSWPKSWWGGGTGPDQHEDLFAVVPADGFVNNMRSNLPLGDVLVATYTSSNNSRRGSCDVDGESPLEQCFEPSNELKGDFARIYFYMAVRYEGEMPCCEESGVAGSDINPWLEEVLRRWHTIDAVDTAEQDRNENVFGIQENRNPFVDYPGLVDRISDF